MLPLKQVKKSLLNGPDDNNKFMIKNKSAFFLFIIPILILGCSNEELGRAPVPENYEQSINEWKEYRVGVLTGPTNWLRLHAIYWLSEGDNSFGSSEENDITFPAGTIPATAGTFTLLNGTVNMTVEEEVTITYDGEPVSDFLLFDGENRPHVEHEDLEWFIDSRGDDHGVRLYNKDNPKADNFDGFPFFPLNTEWHLKAKFIPNTDSTTVTVDNVLEQKVDLVSPGNIRFKIENQTFEMIAFEANSGLFIMFKDETNGNDTYHAGRYMIIPFADENGYTILDFNKAYNPPCAFNTFTTCNLPPPQNRLNVSITAGEKTPVEWEGL
jgi:uncharacterized protein (DUF1684 family)